MIDYTGFDEWCDQAHKDIDILDGDAVDEFVKKLDDAAAMMVRVYKDCRNYMEDVWLDESDAEAMAKEAEENVLNQYDVHDGSEIYIQRPAECLQ